MFIFLLIFVLGISLLILPLEDISAIKIGLALAVIGGIGSIAIAVCDSIFGIGSFGIGRFDVWFRQHLRPIIYGLIFVVTLVCLIVMKIKTKRK